MTGINVGSLTVRLGKPVVVAEGIGHLWFPVLYRFASGELVAQWSMMPDIHCFAYLAGASHSTDGGKTWSPPYSLGNFANQAIALGDGSLRRLPYYIYPEPKRGDAFVYATDHSLIFPGGGNTMTPRGIRVESPRALAVMPTGAAVFNFTGQPLKLGDRYLATAYGAWDDEWDQGRMRFNLYVFESRDEGVTWRYAATVAHHRDLKEEPGEPIEGPNESVLVRLESGEILCLLRVGNYDRYPYFASRSRDEGKTWSPLEALSAGRVEPSLVRLSNGALALSGGRPGIKLWLADDRVGKDWQAIDLMAHHNAACEPRERMDPSKAHTTSYTELLEVGSNRLLCVYDRIPMGWDPVPFGSEERAMILAMPIEVSRR
jgi:hypothetical protein